MEIARVTDHNADLRWSAFKLNSLASKAVIEQFLQIVDKGEFIELLIASVTTLTYLSHTFQATEMRIIDNLRRESIYSNARYDYAQ
ncbi:hypothetical protein ZIOFF_065506 [Zingiber officinale]|uniref:Uncharacterized protein n=1 Tax=Zingiber officinale TaxID=94328 RepID=A0A8J5KH53_ZINOF|nr:hypothetical protein ZIOFF_065506 [Zingiber officinale]